MKTQDLIAALARSEEQPKRGRPWLAALVIGLVTALAIFAAFIGPRTDMIDAIGVVFAKAAFSAAFASIALALMGRLAKPGRPAAKLLRGLAAIFLVSLIIAAIALMGDDPGARMQAWTGGAFPWCLILIPLLALPFALALGFVVKTLAPTRLALTGGAIGAAAGGLGAMVYALHCPIDSIAFVATWYALGIAISAVIGAVIGARFLRW
ncbi:MAG: DUF1109 domain-containing protein [Caulobacterales bacterium]